MKHKRNFLLATILVFIVSFVAPVGGISPAFAATILVNSFTDIVANDGMCTLREAVINANNDNQSGSLDCFSGSSADTILLPSGTYTLDNIAIGTGLVISDDLTLIGQTPGITLSVDPVLVDRAIYIQNSGTFRTNVVFLHVTITGGNTILDGGGIYNEAGNLVLKDSVVYQNTAVQHGGGIYNYFGILKLFNSVIESNTVTDPNGDGGGIFNENGDVTLFNSVIFGNSASRHGGGIKNSGVNASLSAVATQINDNFATLGGGIMNGGGMVEISSLSALDNNQTNLLGSGGAIYSYQQGSVYVSNCEIVNNFADNWGAGIYFAEDGILEITNCDITNNSTGMSGSGGGIHIRGSTVTISNSAIVNNVAGSGSGIDILEDISTSTSFTVMITSTTISENHATQTGGGGISIEDNVYGSIVTIKNCIIGDNTALTEGGGIRIVGPHVSLNINTSEISGNQVTDIPGQGGGISSGNAELTIRLSTIRDNFTSGNGAGLFNANSESVLINTTTFSNNNAEGSGGAIANANSGAITINNSTLSQNTANLNGGAYADTFVFGTPQLYAYNTTIADNSASQNGQSLYIDGTAEIANSIVTTPQGNTNCAGTGTITSLDYNLESDTSCGFNQANDLQSTDPLLTPLGNNGGLTETHALQTSPQLSPAIDAGNPAGCFGDTNGDGALDLLTWDQRLSPRPVDGDGNSSVICDIGAFESQ